eukprot:8104002-Ditylum_brightwellii.AAC.1
MRILNCVMRDAMDMESITPENTRRSFAITMVFVTLIPRSATINRLVGNIFSLLTVSLKSRGSDKSVLLRIPKGKPKSTA